MKLLSLLFSLMIALPTQAGMLDSLVNNDEPVFLPVEQAFPLSYEILDGQLIARWNNADGYYLYQHRIFLEQAESTLEPVYFSAPGKEKDDEAFGLVTAYYDDLEVHFDVSGLSPGEAVLNYQGCADAGLCYPPQRETITLSDMDIAANISPAADITNATDNSKSISLSDPASDNWFADRSWPAIIGIFFLLGLGLTFTPCVLPMVPILTSVVLGQGKRSAKRGFILSSIYVLGMAITYAAAGLIVGTLGAGANIQAWMQAPWVLILFAALFVLLAASMFGLYELRLPSALQNKLHAIHLQQRSGEWLGVMIMGVLSALIVSPCVSAPLAGALVYISTTGNALLGGSALLALGLGMGTPLIIIGTTEASVLPKAGAWMHQIKIFFGVLLLGVAVWLLSRILPGSISLLLWAVLAIAYAVVLGALEPANNGAHRLTKGIAWVLLLYGVMALAGVLMGNSNPLQPLRLNGAFSTPSSATQSVSHTPFYRTDSVADLQQKMAATNTLVMLDLYADWCISCKIMEQEIFSQPDVQRELKDVLWLQLDVTDNTAEQIAFMQSHAIFGPPTILFFNDQNEIQQARITGELEKEEFLQRARQAGY